MGIVLKHSKVALDATTDRRAASASNGACATRSAELVRIDGVPVAVEVTCSCGEVTLVQFVEPDAPDPSAAPVGGALPNTPAPGDH